ncbi:WD40/YVTN/BNR-like repeat-containing protein [Thauera sp. Sel9]|uniref:WD40/YVTN/BNR-like repeat-containing protein n=1 Tax=Thauera sp. Sel9 TaxID=2974299 RepID=UPI0021E180E8|nr:YCF48-related protein [Thauera sp. Sel9]MCV2219133.1 YCF48-related protein [Thauera sp. Sel9]
MQRLIFWPRSCAGALLAVLLAALCAAPASAERGAPGSAATPPAVALPGVPAPSAFRDPLDTPAQPSALAASSRLIAVAAAGAGAVAVGPRGHILYAEASVQQWTQAQVPVGSDLVAVHFPTAQLGWAVGHDGVVLHSRDGGHHWHKQLDGRQAAQRMLEFYEAEVAARGGTATAVASEAEAASESESEAGAALERALSEARHFAEDGPVHPFLDVWFENERQGFIVGAFGLIFRTEDGGESWTPWFHRVDNPMGLHLYGVRGGGPGQSVYAVGERGLILRLDHDVGRFVAVPGDYEGTYFGVLPGAAATLVFGMRGNAYRSTDDGRSWHKVDTGTRAGIPAGAALAAGRVALVSQGGELLLSTDHGASFVRKAGERARPGALAGIAALGENGIAVVGEHGVGAEILQ